MANINLYIDDALNPDDDSQPQDLCQAPSNCALDAEFVIDSDDVDPGPHDLKINTRDFAGNVSTKTLHVTTTIDPDSPEGQAAAGQLQAQVAPTAVCAGGPSYDTFYVGSAVSGNTMSYAQRTCSASPDDAHHDTSYAYGTCSTTSDDAGCQPPLLINSAPLCERHAKLYQQPDGTQLRAVAATIKGVPTASYNQGTVVEVYTGSTTITINASTSTLATAALQALRPAPSANQPTYGAFAALPDADNATVGSSSLSAPSATTLNATSPC